MLKHKLPLSVVLKGAVSSAEEVALCDAINDVALQAQSHLTRARELSSQNLPSLAINALYPALASAQYLQILHDHHYNPTLIVESDSRRILGLQYRLLISKVTKRI